MPTLNFKLDHAGRPIIELYVGVSSAERETLGAEGTASSLLALALVDTGAGRTLIERSVLEQLSLQPVGDIKVNSSTSGAEPVPARTFAVDLALAGENTGVLATDLEVIEAQDLSRLQVRALLGRDVLNRCLLQYHGPNGSFALTYEPFEEP